MSTALERVIAEQQAKIDRLEARLDSDLEYARRAQESLLEIFQRAASVADWWKLRDCWKDDKSREWQEFVVMRLALRTSLREYGFCATCHSMTCECGDD